jgi:hypothetical protein
MVIVASLYLINGWCGALVFAGGSVVMNGDNLTPVSSGYVSVLLTFSRRLLIEMTEKEKLRVAS